MQTDACTQSKKSVDLKLDKWSVHSSSQRDSKKEGRGDRRRRRVLPSAYQGKEAKLMTSSCGHKMKERKVKK
jgi:hypothetical protein